VTTDEQWPPNDRVGAWALALGVAAFLAAFVPGVGEFIAAPTAIAAVVLGLLGIRRYETYHARRAAPAVAGAVLGAAACVVVAFVLLATQADHLA
jgi:tetrahydromethanopterin S-methyltransferase subunit C